MTRKLIALISTKGKTTKQAAKEVWRAFQKFQKMNQKHIKNTNNK